MRTLIFLGGLVAVIGLTVGAGHWLMPAEVAAPASGLEVDAEQLEGAGSELMDTAPTPTPTPVDEISELPLQDSSDEPEEGEEVQLHPTLSWMNVYSESSQYDGFPLPIGSIVRAFDPEGVLAGEFIVKTEGVYGLMAVYMDDAATEVDEGAVVGDALSFEIDGNPADVVGPDEPVFIGDGGLLRLDLTVSSQS